MSQLHLYTGATAGGTDGTEISDNRSFLTPIDVTVNAGESESKTIAVAIRSDTGIKCTNVSITTDIYDSANNAWTGNKDSMVMFSLAESGAGASNVLKLDAVTDTNTIIYVVISTNSLQSPGINKNTSIRVNYTAESVT